MISACSLAAVAWTLIPRICRYARTASTTAAANPPTPPMAWSQSVSAGQSVIRASVDLPPVGIRTQVSPGFRPPHASRPPIDLLGQALPLCENFPRALPGDQVERRAVRQPALQAP
jgi:hypothetical protein